MAMAILNHLAQKNNADICADSMGLAAGFCPASQNAVLAVKELFNADLSTHVSKPADLKALEEADEIFTMSKPHSAVLISALPHLKDKIISAEPEISDPYMQDLEVYKKCATELFEQINSRYFKDEISVLPMRDEHLDALVKIENECFSKPWSRTSFEEELSNPDALFLVAEKSGAVLGYVGCIITCGEGSITNVAVSENARRSGVGSLLIKSLIENAKDKNADSLFLEVRKSNIPAQNLYKKFGFTVCGERKNFYRAPVEDAYILTLDLNRG